MPDPLLELRDVRAGYAEAVVLDGVSLVLPASGSLAVLGRNGVGKTTLLLAMMGFVTLARGSIWLNGTDISRLPPHRRAHGASDGCRRSATSSHRSPCRRTSRSRRGPAAGI
jgi:branched-chain amino acid transport system ATP-binding protein